MDHVNQFVAEKILGVLHEAPQNGILSDLRRGGEEVLLSLINKPDKIIDDQQIQTERSFLEAEHSVRKRRAIPPPEQDLTEVASQLFLLLEQDQTRFCQELISKNYDVKWLSTINNGVSTLLQYACLHNKKEAAATLLQLNVDPNNITPENKEIPLSITIENGEPEILKELLKNSLISPNLDEWHLLHLVAISRSEPQKQIECLHHLLEKEWNDSKKLDINYQDENGNSALHVAVHVENEPMVIEMLKCGAYLGLKNKKGERPLDFLTYDVFKDFLDQQIHYSKAGTGITQKETYTFDLSFLFPPLFKSSKISAQTESEKRQSFQSETNLLLSIIESQDLQFLITHPVLTSFTFLKWQKFQPCFFINLFFYLLLCLVLTGYILFGFHDECDQGKNPADCLPNSTDFPVKVTILVFLLLLTLREIFQVFLNWRTYFKNKENYLELPLIILASLVVFQNCGQQFSPICPQLSAVVILLAWSEFVLLIGKHPSFSVHVEMFRTVSVTFITLLSRFMILIVAFSLSFYVLFRGQSKDSADKNCQPFDSPGISFFKTLVMLTGELNSGELPFQTYIGTSAVIFVAFIFLVVIVLMSLLNGLAVADTKEVRDNAFLFSCISRVEFISLVQEMLLSNFIVLLLKPFPRIFQFLKRKILMLLGEETKIQISPGLGKKVNVSFGENCPSVQYASSFVLDILKSTRVIVGQEKSKTTGGKSNETDQAKLFEEIKFLRNSLHKIESYLGSVKKNPGV